MVELTYKTTTMPDTADAETSAQSMSFATVEEAQAQIDLLESYDVADLIIWGFNIRSSHWLQLTDDTRANFDINHIDDNAWITFHQGEDGVIGEIYCTIEKARIHYQDFLNELATPC